MEEQPRPTRATTSSAQPVTDSSGCWDPNSLCDRCNGCETVWTSAFPSRAEPQLPMREACLSLHPLRAALPFLSHVPRPLLVSPGVISQMSDLLVSPRASVYFWGGPREKTIASLGRSLQTQELRIPTEREGLRSGVAISI